MDGMPYGVMVAQISVWLALYMAACSMPDFNPTTHRYILYAPYTHTCTVAVNERVVPLFRSPFETASTQMICS